jgi:hypothetical protein
MRARLAYLAIVAVQLPKGFKYDHIALMDPESRLIRLHKRIQLHSRLSSVSPLTNGWLRFLDSTTPWRAPQRRPVGSSIRQTTLVPDP